MPPPASPISLPPPLLATEDRLFKLTVCTRPFRAAGPRIEAERVSCAGGSDKLVVHNYGHGGSGWSLSWGSAEAALNIALAGRDPALTDLAVIGCGALGLTAAVLAQRTGVRSVTIYTRDLPPQTRSFNATGSWTPFSRIALAGSAPATLAAQWESMTRTSWTNFNRFLNRPGTPVEFTDRFYLSDLPPDEADQQRLAADSLGFVTFRDHLSDLAANTADFAPGTHPFPSPWLRRRSEMMFNITAYTRLLTEEFLSTGGRIVVREFHSPADFGSLPEPVILHCTGFAARTLFGDTSLTPVRGQIGWLIPQQEALYGLYSDYLHILSRRDGIVIQFSDEGEATGWNNPSELPNRTESERGTRMLQALQRRMHPPPG